MSQDHLLTPNRDHMQMHVEALHGLHLGGPDDGLIEIAWTYPGDKAPRFAKLFQRSEIADAVEHAVNVNTEGVNVYCGPALRLPWMDRDRRTSDAGFLASLWAWADFDAPVGADIADIFAACRNSDIRPHVVCTTGDTPRRRAHIYWRLADPCTNGHALQALNSALATHLRCDASVTNRGRIMRLAGSVSYPSPDKMAAGYIVEVTRCSALYGDRPDHYAIADLIAGARRAKTNLSGSDPEPEAIPRKPAHRTIHRNTGNAAEASDRASDKPLDPMRWEVTRFEKWDTEDMIAWLAQAEPGDNWHLGMTALMARLANTMADIDIYKLARRITAPGYTVEQTLKDMSIGLETARNKYDLPKGVLPPIVPSDAPAEPLTIEPLPFGRVAMIPQRQWIYGNFIAPGHVSLLTGPPGAGKSTYALTMAVALCIGEQLFSDYIHDPEGIKVWVYNAEEDILEIQRRVAAIIQRYALTEPQVDKIRANLHAMSGFDRSVLLARADKSGVVIPMPDAEATIAEIQRTGVRVVMVDPLIDVHTCEENSNEQMRQVLSVFLDIAHKTGCGVLVAAHTPKPPLSQPDAQAGTLGATRGAGSIGGKARFARTIYPMSKAMGDELGVPTHRGWVRVDDAKAQYAPPADEATWLRYEALTIANGDDVAVLVEASPKEAAKAVQTVAGAGSAMAGRSLIDRVIDRLDAAWSLGKPLSIYPQARDRYAVTAIACDLGVEPIVVKDCLDQARKDGRIAERMFNQHRNLKGWRSNCATYCEEETL